MRFAEVAAASEAVAATSARLPKIARMAELLRALEPDEIEPVVAFLSGRPRQGRIGLGYATISAVADVSPAGTAALAIGDVDQALKRLAATNGSGSTRDRVQQLRALFERATAPEQDFLRRLLYGELRQGALEGVVLAAVARAAGLPAASVRRAVLIAGDLPSAAKAAISGGAGALDAMSVRVMQPVRPMLADSADDVDAALDDLADATLEYKLDGARVQIHRTADDVKVFSRTLNDVTASVPEIVTLARALPVSDLILDGEVIALNDDASPSRSRRRCAGSAGRKASVSSRASCR